MRPLALLMLLGFSMATCAVPVSVPGAAARFDAPAGYTSLSQDEISIKFPARRAPANIVGNARRTTTIAFELTQDKLKPEQLSEARQVFEQFFERSVAGLVWRDRKRRNADRAFLAGSCQRAQAQPAAGLGDTEPRGMTVRTAESLQWAIGPGHAATPYQTPSIAPAST